MKESKDTLNQRIKENLTPEQLQDLKDFYVERLVDNMDTKDLVAYVTDDLDDLYKNMPDAEFLDECQNYWDDSFGEVIDEIQDYMKCDFKNPLREPFEETN